MDNICVIYIASCNENYTIAYAGKMWLLNYSKITLYSVVDCLQEIKANCTGPETGWHFWTQCCRCLWLVYRVAVCVCQRGSAECVLIQLFNYRRSPSILMKNRVCEIFMFKFLFSLSAHAFVQSVIYIFDFILLTYSFSHGCLHKPLPWQHCCWRSANKRFACYCGPSPPAAAESPHLGRVCLCSLCRNTMPEEQWKTFRPAKGLQRYGLIAVFF